MSGWPKLILEEPLSLQCLPDYIGRENIYEDDHCAPNHPAAHHLRCSFLLPAKMRLVDETSRHVAVINLTAVLVHCCKA